MYILSTRCFQSLRDLCFLYAFCLLVYYLCYSSFVYILEHQSSLVSCLPVSCLQFGLACFLCPCPYTVSVVLISVFILCLLVFSVLGCNSLSHCYFTLFIVCLIIWLHVLLVTLCFWLPFRVPANYSSALCLGTVLLYLITWLMTPACFFTLISACPIKSPHFCTLCIWVPHLLSLPFTVYNK